MSDGLQRHRHLLRRVHGSYYLPQNGEAFSTYVHSWGSSAAALPLFERYTILQIYHRVNTAYYARPLRRSRPFNDWGLHGFGRLDEVEALTVRES